MPSLYWFANPYYPNSGRSPLYHEYKIPGAWPDEKEPEAAAASPITSKTLFDEALSPPSPTSSSLSSVCKSASSPPTSSSTTPSSPFDSAISSSVLLQTCSTLIDEDEEDYDPSYATYLLVCMIVEDEMKERKENELLYRIQQASHKNNLNFVNEARYLNMLSDVVSVTGPEGRSGRRSLREVRDGWEREESVKRPKGTPPRTTWQALSKKRKTEDDDDERPAKKMREEPRVIAKILTRVRTLGHTTAIPT